MDKQNLEEINLKLKIVKNITEMQNSPKHFMIEDFLLLGEVKRKLLESLKENQLFIDVKKEWIEKINEEYKEIISD